jgi:hypothetical protein
MGSVQIDENITDSLKITLMDQHYSVTDLKSNQWAIVLTINQEKRIYDFSIFWEQKSNIFLCCL